MKAQIRDKAALASLSSIDIRAYLSGQGWLEAGRVGDKAAIFELAMPSGEGLEILLPTRPNLADYADRMADVVATISLAEGRDQLAVYHDLSISGLDVIRLRAPEADDRGTIAVNDGVMLHQQAENLLLAAACSVAKPGRHSYHARKLTEATDYLNTVRLGQTERGSYVMTLLSPVDPSLRRQDTLFPDMEEDPFARQVTRHLAKALTAAGVAINDAVATDDFAAFETATSKGVNANLCEAVAGLAHHGRGVDIGLTWARVRPAPVPNQTWSFSVDAARILEEAAREFRRMEPHYGEEVAGMVVALNRDPLQFDGTATLEVVWRKRTRRLKVMFSPSEFHILIRAFDMKMMVMLEGDIIQTGARYELKNPRNLVLRSDGDTEEVAD